MVEIAVIVAVVLALCVGVYAAGWWLLSDSAPPEHDRDTDPTGEAGDNSGLPQGYALIERRQLSSCTLTLARAVRVRGVRALGWRRVVFVDRPIDISDGSRVAQALAEWSR